MLEHKDTTEPIIGAAFEAWLATDEHGFSRMEESQLYGNTLKPKKIAYPSMKCSLRSLPVGGALETCWRRTKTSLYPSVKIRVHPWLDLPKPQIKRKWLNA